MQWETLSNQMYGARRVAEYDNLTGGGKPICKTFFAPRLIQWLWKDYITMSSPFTWVMAMTLSKRKKRSYPLKEVKYHVQRNPSAPRSQVPCSRKSISTKFWLKPFLRCLTWLPSSGQLVVPHVASKFTGKEKKTMSRLPTWQEVLRWTASYNQAKATPTAHLVLFSILKPILGFSYSKTIPKRPFRVLLGQLFRFSRR